MNQAKEKLSRRRFLETTTIGAAGLMMGSPSRSNGAIAGSNERVSVGVIGPGGQGTSLIRNFVTVPNASITAMCDIFEPNLKKGVDLAGTQPKTFEDYRKLLENKTVDAVLIAVPLHLHAEVVLAALDAGKHVFVEKTMGYSVNHCEQMLRASKAHPKLAAQVGYQHRFDPVIRKVTDMCRDGALGTITHIRCTWHRNASWRRPVPKINFDPSRWGYADLEHLINWRMYKRYSGGLMCELGSHMIEICNLILRSKPSVVTGLGGIDYWKDGRETYDNVSVVYNYPGGQKVSFSSTTTNAHDGERIVIMGTDGTIEMGWDKALYYREKASPELVKGGATVITSTGETMKASAGQEEATQIAPQEKQKLSAIYRELDSFVTCIREGKKALVDFEVGRNAAVSVLSANQAMEEGRVVKF